MKKYLLITTVFLLSKSFCIAQKTDAEDCGDSPFFKRLPNTFIAECFKDSDEVEVTIYPDSSLIAAGIKTFISYGYDPAKAKSAPTFAQIVKIYENAVIKKGGKKMYYSADEGKATLFFKSSDKEVWTVVDDGSGDGEGYYSITILEAIKHE